MRPGLTIGLLLSSATVASAPIASSGATLDQALAQAEAEAASADAEAQRLGKAAANARTEAVRLRAQQLAAAQAIAAAEARISAADAELRLIAVRQEAMGQRLNQQQRPISALLAGLATMAARPPLAALASANGTDDLVEMRLLVDATLPVIAKRTETLRRQLSAGALLQQSAAAAKARLQQGQSELASKRQHFAALEQKAVVQAANTELRALAAGDTALGASETADALRGDVKQGRVAAAIASELARMPAPPAGPGAGAARSSAPFPYMLPVNAPVLVGLGAVSSSGVRSRGVLLGARRGSVIVAPASGVIRFAGPFEDYDGVVIIDHGRGWISLIVNVASTLQRGGRVTIGQGLGRALGPVEVELSQDGKRLSPALIAGSSAALSKGRQDG
jgi:septal ring factor EnvC (AmiA/AmiB activator)